MNTPSTFCLENVFYKGTAWTLLVQDGLILASGPTASLEIPATLKDVPRINGEGCLLFPSFIDAHVHLREPGFEYKENIESGLKAAAHGGFGTVMPMANTRPVNDSASITRNMLEKAHQHWPHGPRLCPVGALSLALEGKELAPYGELAEAGCVAISNDGKPVPSTEIFRRAVEYASHWGLTVIDHCEDPTLASGWHMNEGVTSGQLGIKGQPVVGESVQVARNVLLAEYLGISIHLAHISCRQSVELIAWAKSRGVRVTAETCPHYLLLDETRLEGYAADAKVSPPLRSADDVQAIKKALASGVIDMLVTDHAPHAPHEKEDTIDQIPFGFIGLETAVSLTYDLVRQKVLDEATFIDRWHTTPATVFGLPVNTLKSGDAANFFLFDPHRQWTVCRETLHSKSINTPFYGQTLTGQVVKHWLEGHLLVSK